MPRPPIYECGAPVCACTLAGKPHCVVSQLATPSSVSPKGRLFAPLWLCQLLLDTREVDATGALQVHVYIYSMLYRNLLICLPRHVFGYSFRFYFSPGTRSLFCPYLTFTPASSLLWPALYLSMPVDRRRNDIGHRVTVRVLGHLLRANGKHLHASCRPSSIDGGTVVVCSPDASRAGCSF